MRRPRKRRSAASACGYGFAKGRCSSPAASASHSTVHRILVASHLNRLSHVDRATGEPIRRYEHPHPGSLIHVDVKKLGNIPDGGDWRLVGRKQGGRNRLATPDRRRNKYRDPRMGHAFVHAERGITVERVLSDNGGAYCSYIWRDTCAALGITPKHTRPYRPQTNGKIERFHRTLADGWAYARCYTSEAERRQALGGWLHYYNHYRPHIACSNEPPFTRLTNVPGQYT